MQGGKPNQNDGRPISYMAATYRITAPRRILNRLVKLYVRLGLPPRKYQLLSVRGRRSGRMQTTPISVLEAEGQRWLVCPYGERQWVKNARAAGVVTLARGRRTEAVRVEEESDPVKCAEVLKRYIRQEPITRKFFNVKPDSPIEDFVREAPLHVVFRIAGPAA